MKIVIGTVQVPFVVGGAELLARNLKKALMEFGYEADIVTMPFMDSPLNRIEEHIIAARLMDQEWSWGGKSDLFIGLKFPAFYMPHPNKVIWALHQHRQAYDLFNTQYSNIKDDTDGRRIREIIRNADNHYLLEAKKIFTISKNIVKRMKKFNGITATALYHPCPDMDKFYTDKYENYILMPSRINITKRQILALKAMIFCKENVKLYLVGKAEAEYERKRLLDYIKAHRLENRVKLFDFVSEEKKLELYANARAVLFIPLDEDYGYITLEAMSAGKAVITASDSGGPLEFVENQSTGFVVSSSPEAIAQSMDQVTEDINLAIKYGENGRSKLNHMNISWENVVKELTKN